MAIDDTPEDLHANQYAIRLLEDLEMPAKGNIDLVGECIAVIAKKRRIKVHEAYEWLAQRATAAQKQGQKVNSFWFRDGEYNYTDVHSRPTVPEYEPVDREALEREQASPEWQAQRDELRAKLKQIANRADMKGAKR